LKLDWRLDWPARWALYGVQVEPFGRDHAARGGSYQTGEVLVREIFGKAAPYPVPYEFINPVGETKKMSKSDGKGITPNDLLEVMPAEVLRYFIARPRPGRTLQFDSGVGVFNLIDEYSKLKAAENGGETVPDANAMGYAAPAKTADDVISGVPFNHLVSVYQAAQGDIDRLDDILKRTGYEVKPETLKHEAQFVASWLAKFAPDSVKFNVQKTLPDVELGHNQQEMLAALADKIDGAGEVDGEIMHNLIYAARDETGLKPAEAFQAIYRIILGQDSGPKAGWFLASLDRDWLVKRLRQQE
jgi:lysyl-tRNA synthetase, class I